MTQGKRAIQELLERYDLVPRRALGQHFLADPNLVRKLVGLAAVDPGGAVVEVGREPAPSPKRWGRPGSGWWPTRWMNVSDRCWRRCSRD